jgi:hypothetical protein
LREKEENYQFAHEDYKWYVQVCYRNFDNPSSAHEISKKSQHTLEQSNHPHIKNGEVYVTHLSNVSIDNNVVDAIGILKVKSADFTVWRKSSI